VHFRRRGVALGASGLAGFEDDLIEPEEIGLARLLDEGRGQFRVKTRVAPV